MISSGRATVQLLEHEQRALVQPNFDRLSCAFARLVSIGSATSFEVRGVRQEVAYFTSFYLYSLTRGMPARAACANLAEDHPLGRPLAVAGDERRSPLPEVRGRHRLIDASLRRIVDEARIYASMPCVLPLSAAGD